MDARIHEDLLRFGPSSAADVAHRLGLPEHDVERRLRLMFGHAVARAGTGWRAISAHANLAETGEAVVQALRLQNEAR